MPEVAPEPDTIYSNIKLIASWRNLNIFITAPPLSNAWMMYPALHLSEEGFLPAKPRLILAIASMVTSGIMMEATVESIAERLREQGYEQKRTGERQADFLLNLLVGGACWYMLRDFCEDEENRDAGPVLIYGVMVLIAFLLWSMMVLLSIGPVLWYTVRAG
ncbi:hypothetical protein CLAFUW4_05227 [Fulvia fulva]|uniref:Uncharacterized protein n=1 Tax=Passalora fulva TaxID=5499 RepID=A0A9Q8UUJ4_PASFU|nr:uncharacterized protein CLAFUR5_11679 [Fulvia fulva]KAK4626238.1 hypothetical protein CLAFUR4_05213 [Fulvia fulva]KAK4627932.1 hypothetical protein CLAFUR0_05219 [Fulvia fulva]UJO23019.1 hypothetical protein CLAFUR5_11679 [Fulvia fulva]WPV13267.1 hypothetical protein CLAFUW4_05227 [Fulvia fulva]WPV28098.1 hypothetical protein CLAFUW7_05223 [Fulvia fulva]